MGEMGMDVRIERGNADLGDIWQLIIELAESQGVQAINQLPGCWEVRLDERWAFAVNAHPEARTVEAEYFTRPAASVRSCDMYVEFRGWPAGMLNPGGGMFAAGEVANLESFAAALRAAARGGQHGDML